ncbi:MAG: patatin-like phospholipase family protein [Burkholderiales bacterium]
MNDKSRSRHEYDYVILVLQGGGALGAYQAGVFEGLAECGYAPNWIAGVSIGAINAALIAGNTPERRVERLRTFWDLVSSGTPSSAPKLSPLRLLANRASAAMTAIFGVPGFFVPRLPPPFLMPDGNPGALSFYDAGQLRGTLDRLVDFELLNRQDGVRVSIGAANVRTGNSQYFDTCRHDHIGPDHVMASGALPPAFPPVVIKGEHYWDGGIVSNTPLWYVLDEIECTNALIVQVDLFSAEGAIPQNIDQVLERHKEMVYSSKTRFNTARVRELQRQRNALHRLLRKLPDELRNDRDAQLLEATTAVRHIDVVHLINRRYSHTAHSKDYEFSRATIRETWEAGLEDVRRTVAHPEWLKKSSLGDGIHVYDLARERESIAG